MTKLTSLFIATFSLLLAACSEPQEEWITLLNRNDLSNWTFDIKDGSPIEETYSIKNGVLSVFGAGKDVAVIRTKKDFSNFELEYEWRWPNEPGNSGCLIFCSTPRERNVWPKSLEIQMANGNAGDFIYIGETIEVTEAQVAQTDPNNPKDWRVRLRHNLTDDSEKPAGEWNHARIISDNGNVSVYVNGELVNKGWNATGRAGAICFQAEKADVQYRGIKILPR
ncbi:3-keto-disaccharide hydrolase [Pelagicoccus mobilis]|uniref:DUF1080 domain-containing protein n=1 Tax=Pelagicoccus mobilis TaxID=415221 RepID=A0A934VPW8_9BACT|nr:DUF1080 domain-containing protein [Pelagicoccus mobilis]MBK1876260.1 DUF1080 domain-containing protein [Pelagicoccus mobilis]